MVDRINNLHTADVKFKDLQEKLAHDPEYLLPQSPALMLAKSYWEESARPLIKKLKSIIKKLFVEYHKVVDNLHRISFERDKLQLENSRLRDDNSRLISENTVLKEQNKGFRQLRKVFGTEALDYMLKQAKQHALSHRHSADERTA